jgi:hypothetical protein
MPVIEDIYEHPTADEAIVSALREALANVPDLHEAYLVNRRRRIDGDKVRIGLGVVARVGSRWRGAPRQVAALGEALKPFSLPGDSALLHWGQYGNDSVPKEVKAVGVQFWGHS